MNRFRPADREDERGLFAGPKPLPLTPQQILAQLEALIATGRATTATRTRAEALRRQLAAAEGRQKPTEADKEAAE